ncbi:MAG TPA: amidohydrolase family protein, partial [Phycisphaerae bacterium]|nr:amidohydrolase family protein [Phycisphaerae bacterium]
MTRPAHVWRRLAVGVTATALLCLCGGGDQLVVRPATQSAAAAPADKASFVLRAKAVYPATVEQPGPLPEGMVVVRSGRIVAVGRQLAVPPDLPLIELRDEVICPGFVSAGGSLVRPHAGPQSVSAAFHAVDAFDTYDDYVGPLSRGTTTAYLSPGEHRLVSGLGAVVKLGGAPEERTVVPAADLAVTFGEFDPPLLYKPPFYASSDVPIEPARGQRPDSRLGQFIELEERIAAAEQGAGARAGEFDIHAHEFAAAWAAALPLRIQVRRAVDIEGALRLVERLARGGQRRSAYLVGLTEGDRLLDVLGDDSVAAVLRSLPLVVRVERSFRAPGPNIGDDPEALEPRLATAERIAARLPGVIALAGAAGDDAEDLRMAAVLAVRGGLSAEQALAGITRVPAEILRVADRVGSLTPGTDADLLVLSGAPLDINSF